VINRKVLMSDARHFSNEQPINPYYHIESVDLAVAQQEHDRIRDMMQQAGIEVVQAPAPADSQDGVYTANWALVRGDKAVLACLPNARKAEEPHARQVLTSLGFAVVEVPDGLKFSGQGDALPCGDLLFCGSTYRSDEAAQDFAAQTLGYRRIQLRAVPLQDAEGNDVINTSSGWPDSLYYDLDLALSVLRGPENGQKGLIAYCPAAFTPESQQILEDLTEVDKIIVSEHEAKDAFACNLVSTGSTVIMSARAPQFSAELVARGFTLLQPEIHELLKGGGYIRCTTLTLS
jgi:N-dimethylarginine dimethylaminohydrolase